MNTAVFFITAQWIAVAVLFVLLIYAKLQKPSEMQKYSTLLIFGMMMMLIGYTMEMQADNLQAAYYATVLSYIGEPFVMVSAYLLIAAFYEKKIPKGLTALLLTSAAINPIMVYTNPYHYLYYSYVGFDASNKYSPLVLVHGPLYLINIAFVIGYLIAIIYVVAKGYGKSKSALKKRLSVYSVLMVISAFIGFAVYTLGLTGGYDCTITGLMGSTIFLMMLFFRCRIFDVVETAKDYALDISAEGLIVYDDANNKVYENSTARDIVDNEISEDYLNKLEEGNNVYRYGRNVYRIFVYKISKQDNYLGKAIEIRNITETYTHGQKLEAAVASTREKLEDIQRTIFGSFANLVEARSLETGDHVRRVCAYTEVIAANLKKNRKYADILTDDYVEMLVASAPLHDLGKISVSDTILLKPGKLTPEEFEEMKKHAALGGKIVKETMSGLESEAYVEMAAEVATYHHERWDGTGYPLGLAGDQIPLSARIVAVADCFDAMTSKRCYKDEFPEEKAIAIIKEESGTHFDPEIVEAFLERES